MKHDAVREKALQNKKVGAFQRLREKAERVLDKAPPQASELANDAKRLLHELNVLHIELEMQHEELLDAQRELEKSRDDYARLFDFAPMSYLVMDSKGVIQDLNLNASDLFGARREYLMSKPLMTYLQGQYQQRFLTHRSRLFESGKPQTDELELALRHGRRARVLLQSQLLQGLAEREPDCLTALIDITELRETQDELNQARVMLSKDLDERSNQLFESNRKLEEARKDLEQGVQERTAELEGANNELRETEDRWRTLFMTTPDSITLSTLEDGRLVDVNEGFCALTGYSLDEAVGKTSIELGIWSQEDREALAAEFRDSGLLHNKRTTFVNKNGSRVEALVSARSILMQQTPMVITVAHDIRDLRRAEEKYRSIFDNSSLGIFRSTLQDRMLDVNPAMAAMLGYASPQELMQNVEDIASDLYVDAEQRAAIFESLDNGNEGRSFEVEFRRKGGDIFIGRLHLHSVQEGAGMEPTLEGFIEDISKRKRTEEALREAEERYRKATTAGRTAVWEVDLRTGEIATEGQLERLLGLQTPMKTLRDMVLRIHPEDREYCSAVWEQCMQGTLEHYDVEPRMLNADGDIRWFSIQGTMIRDEDGGNLVATGTARDITEKKQMEIELRRAKEQAVAASQAKSSFLTNMSHEIRTPLGNILGVTALTLTTPLREDQLKYLGLIKESATSLLTIINDLLDISRIEAGKLEIEHAPFVLRPLLDNTLAQFEGQAREKRISLLLDLASPLPETLAGDQGRLGQVLRNLISNAIKFTENGEVRLETRLLDASDKRTRLLFTVRDTGNGISPEDQHKLFKSFSQLSDSLAGKTPGSGLGLAISKQLVEAMGGSIWLESEKGKGAAFHFTISFHPFQMRERLAEHAAIPGEATADLRCLRILLAEDNPVNAEFVIQFLLREGHAVSHAATGAQTLELFEAERFDVVLMDIQMPDMDGMEVTRAIRKTEHPLGAHTPIIALTAYAMDADKDRFLQAGMNDCVTKPVDIEVLLRTIAGHVSAEAGPVVEALPKETTGPDSLESNLPHFDEEQALKMVRGHRDIILLLRQKFLYEAAPQLLERMRISLAEADVASLHSAVHSLKGSASTVCAMRTLEITLALEAMDDDLEQAPALLESLEQEFRSLEELVPRD